MANSHGPPVRGATSTSEPPPMSPSSDHAPQGEQGDKSVLQAKLTNLAIQIG